MTRMVRETYYHQHPEFKTQHQQYTPRNKKTQEERKKDIGSHTTLTLNDFTLPQTNKKKKDRRGRKYII